MFSVYLITIGVGPVYVLVVNISQNGHRGCGRGAGGELGGGPGRKTASYQQYRQDLKP